MDKLIILQKFRMLKPILQQNYGLSEIALFGSYSRDEQTPESDIDIMVDSTHLLALSILILSMH